MAVNSIVLQNPFGDAGDGDIISGDILGRIGFSAPSETGADALLVTALISAVAEEPFTASANKTKILFSTADGDAATARLAITGDGHLVPAADDTYDLGTASLEFRNGYFDGTLEADAITLGGTALGSLYSPIAGSSSIATVGTIGTGTWEGTTIAVDQGGTGATSLDDITSANNMLTVGNGADTIIGGDVTLTVNVGNIDHDSLSNFVANEHIDWTGASAGTIHATNYTNTTYSEATSSAEGLMSTAHHDKLDGIEASATADQTKSDIDGLAITTVGAIDTGSWTATDVAIAHGGTGSSTASGARTNLGLVIGTNVQAYDADLAAIAGLTSAADKGIQFTGSGSAATYDLTAAGKALLDDANASAQRTTLGLAIGSDVQAYDADLAAIAGLTSAADKGIQFTGSGAAATYDLTAAGKALLDDADAAAQRTTLGVDAAGTDNSPTLSISGSYDYISAGGTKGHTLTVGQIDLAADVTGTLPVGSVSTITLGTNTAGNYVATIADAGNNAITVANCGSETAAVTLDIADNAVGIAELAGIARGKMIVGDASGNPALLTAGDEDDVLTMDSNGDVVWAEASGGGGSARSVAGDTDNGIVTWVTSDNTFAVESNLSYTGGDLLVGGSTPSVTIGDAGTEDTKLVFDGAAQDFYIGLDDTDDDLKIGLGSAVGTTAVITMAILWLNGISYITICIY